MIFCRQWKDQINYSTYYVYFDNLLKKIYIYATKLKLTKELYKTTINA